jgi:hypothetical protein
MSEGVLCATGRASLGDGSEQPSSIDDYEHRVPPQERPAADEASLAEGNWLSTVPLKMTLEASTEYLRDVRESDGIYAREGLLHPGALLRQCNLALRQNVVLPPWIHTGSKVTNFSAATSFRCGPASPPTMRGRATASSTSTRSSSPMVAPC